MCLSNIKIDNFLNFLYKNVYSVCATRKCNDWGNEWPQNFKY